MRPRTLALRLRTVRLEPPSPADPFRCREPEREPLPSPATGARLWLVRHGRVAATDATYGDADVPLSAAGEADTAEAVRSLAAIGGVAAVFSSPLVRARTMGAALADALHLPLAERDGLRELHRGQWQGLARDEYMRRWRADADAFWRDPLRWNGHGGESEADLVARGAPVLEEAARAAPGATAVLTAHRQIIRALVAAAIGLPPGRSHALQLDPGGGVLLEAAPHGWVLHRSNVVPAGAPQATEPEGGPPRDVPFAPPG